ncbi:glycosyltransferase [Bacteroides zhangwenhongii]|uniref:glycosyltransferase n=1 Tax=Bacteroides zhangwenhongii TaxID=2650157 RepID=UPI0022E702C7|nr:glycosyltransferase [Bacteroides zhangwenhongii]
MKIALLQSGNQGFFPRFYSDLARTVEKNGDELRLFVPNTGINNRRKVPHQVIWGSRLNWHFHFYMYRLTGLQDIWSFFSTIDLIRKIRKYSPDVINFHVVNDCNLCIPLLVRYINNHNIPVVWTFHDVRAITGRCAYFDEVGCYKWKTGCYDCPTNNNWLIPSLVDNTRLEWKIRKKWFTIISNLTIVTPSEWLACYVRESYFKDHPILVINNGIDTSEFAKEQTNISSQILNNGKKIILGVASVWNKSKGIDTMEWLGEHLGDDYQVVVVGNIENELKKKALHLLCLPPTNIKSELIAIYQKADVFVNPTMEDNFPTVNIEALASGIPVITYKTGGSAECLDSKCGIAVEKGNRKALLEAVIYLCSHFEAYSRENCIERSKCFSLSQFDKYVELYHCVSNK